MTSFNKKYGKYSADELRVLIGYLPMLEEMLNELSSAAKDKQSLIFEENTVNGYWFEFYEMPFAEHFARVATFLGLASDIKKIDESLDPTQALLREMAPLALKGDVDNVCEELPDQYQKDNIPMLLGHIYSLASTLRCVLVYGFYLNGLMDIAKNNLNTKKR